MDFLVFLLLALDLRVLAFDYSLANNVKVVDYNTLGQGICPKVKQPLCATDGVKFLYFENKCLLEVKNYNQLLQGLQEFYECPLSYCRSAQCAPCDSVNDPVCAVEVATGQMINFANPCEVERRICTTQKDYYIISAGACSADSDLQNDCPQTCNSQYNPVCAQFNMEIKEFTNQCELQKVKCQTKANWEIVDPSDCISISGNSINSAYKTPSQNIECPQLCTMDYQPICAKLMSLEKEFFNECELKTTICQTKQKWDIIRYGPCLEYNEKSKKELPKQKPNCPKFCPLIYKPICAIYNNELREFGNSCELERTNCETYDKWEVVIEGPCSPSLENEKPKCPEFCTLEYRPICAKLNYELREFSNNCDLQRTICQTNEKWEVVNKGPCNADEPDEKPKCSEICTLEYKPICAKLNYELREFSNNCDLQRTICQTNEKWEVVKQGPCNTEEPDDKSKCPEFCTFEYRPICARLRNELREFPNNCALQSTICETNQKWKIVKQGPCYTPDAGCPQSCTKEYSPVCAEFKGEQREFSNKCELLRTICETNNKWEVIKLGTCSMSSSDISSPCPQYCTQEYKPVCAKFNNQQREFPNSCELTRYNCESNEEWVMLNKGTCIADYPDMLSLQATCPKFCTREYKPICAKFGYELKEFANKCELLRTNCEDDKYWEIVSYGPCASTCPKFCTREYNPVCAKFNQELREFSNKCELQKFNCESKKPWEIVNLGPCSSNPQELECPKVCTEEYRPVCAEFQTVLREFGNKCDLQRTICETNEDWKFVNEGPCLTKYPVKPICPKLCTKEYSPVCARFKEELREFSNECEMKRSMCETKIDWEVLYKGPCLIKSPKSDGMNCDSEELDPICAIFEFSVKTFNNLCQLSEEIKSTGIKWSILHKGICDRTTSSTSSYKTSSTTTGKPIKPIPYSTVSDKTYYIETDKTTTTKTKPTTKIASQTTVKAQYYTTTAKPYMTYTKPTTTSTTKKPNKPKYKPLTTTPTPTTTTMSKYSTTKKPTTTKRPDSSVYIKTTTSKKYPSTATTTLKTTTEPNYTTSEQTITTTTLEPTTAMYTTYSSTSSSISTDSPGVYEYSIEEYSDEDDDCFDESYDEDDDNCGCSSHEYDDYNSPEKEDEEDEEDGQEEEEIENESSNSYETTTSYTTKDDPYTYKHNDSDSSYTFAYETNATTSSNNYTKNGLENIYLNEEYSKDSNSEKKYSTNNDEIYGEYNDTKIDVNYEGEQKKAYAQETSGDGYDNLGSYSSYETPAYTESSQTVTYGYGATTVKEPKFGVYSSEAYGTVEPTEPNKNLDYYNSNNMANNYNQINTNNNMNSYETTTLYQDTQNSNPNESVPEYYNPIETNYANNITKALEVFEALLAESDDEEDDDDSLVKQVLTSAETKTTAAYPMYEKSENQLNYTKRNEYSSKYNNTNSKKGEIYNGAVYKAPVYDAPTYNFIYTAPNHPVYSLPPTSNPFLNYPGIMPKYPEPAVSQYNPFMAPFNQTAMGSPAPEGPGLNVPFNPMQFFSSLAAAAASHATSPPPEDTQLNALYNENIQTNDPLSRSNSPVYTKILPNTHPSPQLFLPFSPEQFLSPNSPPNNIASQMPYMMSEPQKRENKENQPASENTNNIENSLAAEQSPYPIPALQTSMPYYLTNQQQQQQNLPFLPNSPYQSLLMPYQQSSAPLQLSPPAPSPAFNATLINQITETLKKITSRY